jgi:hypothetical protein
LSENPTEDRRNPCKKLWNDYNKVHGCRSKFRRFFLKYLDDSEKINLLRKTKICGLLFWDKWPSDKGEFLPFCYQGKVCEVKYYPMWSSRARCTFQMKPDECPLVKSKRQMKDTLQEFK